MIRYITGNILESDAEALVNTVNTVGVMGKGVAFQFKKTFPRNYKEYVAVCKKDELEVGKMFVVKDHSLATGDKFIINFPTKKEWRKPSQYSYIESGLKDLVRVLNQFKIKSIAIPPLGAGNGGLEWGRVKKMIEKELGELDVDIIIFEPSQMIRERLVKEKVGLTPARALLLYVLYDLVKNGEYVSEFSSEKVSYFLQRFGAEKFFNLQFKPNFYGPYSGKVRFTLNVLNGSYIMGFNDMDRKPFHPLVLLSDGFEKVKNDVESDSQLYAIAERTINFLTGFYSDFALEMLSTIDFLTLKEKTFEPNLIREHLDNWSNRKKSLFSSNPKYIDVSLKQILKANFVS